MTFLLWGIWISFGFTYYGTILILPDIFPATDNALFNYPALFITSAAEVNFQGWAGKFPGHDIRDTKG